MKYEMPALTDEHERDQLILAARIIYEYPNNDPRLIKVAQIALAALTAEKLTTVYQGTRGRQCVIGSEVLPLGATEVYAVPPVPALKPIEIPSADHETDDSYVFYRKESVISAIRAAGYEVKE